MLKLIRNFFGRPTKNEEANIKKDKTEERRITGDPLDAMARYSGWKSDQQYPTLLNASAFPVAARSDNLKVITAAVGDSKITGAAMDADNSDAACSTLGSTSSAAVPVLLQQWYMTQTFIGYQACAIIAQHWLVDKACSMAGEDAIRNGWELNAVGDEADLTKEDRDALRSYDIPFKLKANLAELNRFKNIFGIRVAIFVVESNDPDYYEKPFNIDGVAKGSYKGISQVDPYWMMPMMTAESTSNPGSMHFYDPEFWVVSGKKYHRSHLIISRGPQPADVLKPTYIFGGIPLTQRIYERVYAAERTANEAPLLALSKRTTALHVDVEKALTNQEKFEQKLMFWIKYRDNHAVKVLGKEETMEQFDTNLADFDSVIMNQYQLVSAIAKVPATKMLGTSPKGFSATGEFEEKSYHEELESIQEHDMAPMAERHYLILGRSLGIAARIEVVFNDVDSMTAAKQAELNKTKSETNKTNVEIGAIAPDEVRSQLRDDKHSGYNNLADEAIEPPTTSPEGLEAYGKAGQQVGAQPQGAVENTDGDPATEEGILAASNTPNKPLQLREPGIVRAPDADLAAAVKILTERLMAVEEHLIPNGRDLDPDGSPATERTVKPSVTGLNPTVAALGAILPPMDPAKHPKMKVSGLMLSIENPRGTVRQGMDLNGKQWAQKMSHHYGFIRGVGGADGDELDCFVGPNLGSTMVFVINQNDPASGEFDEHKCMLGFDSIEDATAAYHAAYSTDWKGFGNAVQMGMDEFKHWLKSIDVQGATEPFMFAQDDKGDFKEGDHPRAKNGQFGSGGSGAASAPKKTSSAKLGSKKDALPNLAKSLTEKNGKAPTPEQFHAAAVEAGFEIIPAQSVKYLKMYLNAQKAGGEKPAGAEKKEAPKVAEIQKNHKELSQEKAKSVGYDTPAEFAAAASKQNGYASEGKYNGIDYFKSPNGDKVSYKADSDTWAAISGGKLTAQGSGIESMSKHLEANKAKPAAKNTMAAAPVSAEHHSTATAKAYGDTISAEKFSFAKSGIANEKALPAKVKESIVAYKGNSYHEINDAMRFNEAFDPDKVSAKTMANILNLQRAFAAVAPSQKDAVVGRKFKINGLQAMAKDAGLASIDDLKPGMVLREPAIVSTSHSPDVWSGNVRFEIKLPKGSKAIDISETISLNKSEQEVLLGPDSKFKIHTVNKDHKGYKYHIVCELVQ